MIYLSKGGPVPIRTIGGSAPAKVPLGSNVDLTYMTTYPSKTLVLRGE